MHTQFFKGKSKPKLFSVEIKIIKNTQQRRLLECVLFPIPFNLFCSLLSEV